VKFPMDHKIKRPHGPWIPSHATDVRKTFERVRQEQKLLKRIHDDPKSKLIRMASNDPR